jgi:hypothetical protein
LCQRLVEAHKTAWVRFDEITNPDDLEEFEQTGKRQTPLDEITSTSPTTVAGMRAVIEYLPGT